MGKGKYYVDGDNHQTETLWEMREYLTNGLSSREKKEFEGRFVCNTEDEIYYREIHYDARERAHLTRPWTPLTWTRRGDV